MLTIQPGLLLKIFGYATGAYISIPNYGLFDEGAVSERMIGRHSFIRSVPWIVYVVTCMIAWFSPVSILTKVLVLVGIMFVTGMVASAGKRNSTHVLENENT